MRILVALTMAIGLAPTSSLAVDTLNKCIDAQGKVTYSNLPCRNAKEVQTVEIDPPPLPEPVRTGPGTRSAASKAVQPLDDAPPQPKRPSKGSAAGKAPTPPSARECESLSEKLGTVLDQMDKAHRKGYTQDQMDKWNQEAKALEKKKQQAGCF